jgi:hypothetical protein
LNYFIFLFNNFELFNLGTCSNGTEAVGCGPQEEFRACADITITEPDGTADETPNTLVNIIVVLLWFIF